MANITVYRITGRQLLFKVPQSYCEECDLSVAAAQKVAKKMKAKGINVDVVVRPWVDYFFHAILKGIWHPPGVVVNGKLISQGLVPTKKDLEKAILSEK